MSKIKTSKTDFSVKMSDNPMVFGYKHAENQPENFEVFTSPFSDVMKDHADDSSGIRVLKREEWKTAGFDIQNVDGVDVLTHIFDRTKKTILDAKASNEKVEAAPPSTVEQLLSEMQEMKAKIKQLESQDSSSTAADSVDAENSKALSEEADTLNEFADDPKEDEGEQLEYQVYKFISDGSLEEKPLVKDLKAAGINANGNQIQSAWESYKSK